MLRAKTRGETKRAKCICGHGPSAEEVVAHPSLLRRSRGARVRKLRARQRQYHVLLQQRQTRGATARVGGGRGAAAPATSVGTQARRRADSDRPRRGQWLRLHSSRRWGAALRRRGGGGVCSTALGAGRPSKRLPAPHLRQLRFCCPSPRLLPLESRFPELAGRITGQAGRVSASHAAHPGDPGNSLLRTCTRSASFSFA